MLVSDSSHMNSVPTVSVIIPTYNRADLLPAAIDSVLRQTYSDFEVIVVDDGSTDSTSQVVSRYSADWRVKYAFQKNQGRAMARNYGASLARGEFLGFLDSDDEYLPDNLAGHLKVFAQQPALGMTVGGYQYMTEAGDVVEERRPWEEDDSLSVAGWLFNCLAMPGSILLRRSEFERIGGFDPDCEIAEDWDLFIRLAYRGCQVEWNRQMSCRYRLHSGSSTHSLALHHEGSIHTLDKFFNQADLPDDLASLTNKAKAWVNVIFAKRAYTSRQAELAMQYLQEAIRLDPELGTNRKLDLLETLFIPSVGWQGSAQHLSQYILAHFPTQMKVAQHEIRSACARAEMSQFFRLLATGEDRPASMHLAAGLKLDPRWFANRGVLSYTFRRWLSWGGTKRQDG